MVRAQVGTQNKKVVFPQGETTFLFSNFSATPLLTYGSNPIATTQIYAKVLEKKISEDMAALRKKLGKTITDYILRSKAYVCNNRYPFQRRSDRKRTNKPIENNYFLFVFNLNKRTFA